MRSVAVCLVVLLAVGLVSCEKEGSSPDGGSGNNIPTTQTISYDEVIIIKSLGQLEAISFLADNKSYPCYVSDDFFGTLTTTENLIDTDQTALVIEDQVIEFSMTVDDSFRVDNGTTKTTFIPKPTASLTFFHRLGNRNLVFDSVEAKEINRLVKSAAEVKWEIDFPK